MGETSSIGTFEELVLLATLRLGTNAYGVTIHQAVEDAAQKTVTIGAIYTTLERLEAKGYVSSRQGEATPERGGRAKRYFKVEGAGTKALDEMERMRAQLRTGLRSAGGVA